MRRQMWPNGGLEIVDLKAQERQVANGTHLGFNGLRAKRREQDEEPEEEEECRLSEEEGEQRQSGQEERDDEGYTSGNLAEIEVLDSMVSTLR